MKKIHIGGIEIGFEKDAADQVCNICLKPAKLTEDHVPPKGVVGNHAVVVDTLASRLATGKAFQQNLIAQNGIKFMTLCGECNGRMKHGDKLLQRFAADVLGIIESPLYRLRPVKVPTKVNGILRSVLGHLVAAKTKTDDVSYDASVRPCLTDYSIPVPEDIHLCFWVYPFRTIRICRDFLMPTVRGKYDAFSTFQVLKFYPLAFLVTDAPNYHPLYSWDDYRATGINESVDVTLHLDGVPPEDWPESPARDNFALFGKTGIESRLAVKRT
jgi:hypothetical protein